jgi:hypothetical protein
MLYSVDKFSGYTIQATDGEIGEIKGFYFDEDSWRVRYLIVDTGKWLPGRKVIISTEAFGHLNREDEALHVNLSKDMIRNSPSVDEDKPLSRQVESQLNSYYGWHKSDHEINAETPDVHLRSTKEVIDSYIQARDGDIGHVEDFLIDDSDWTVRYMIVDTRNWWPGKKVLISPQWVESVSWHDSKVYVDLTREKIKNSPEYDSDYLPDRDYEERLYNHYDRPGYWSGTHRGYTDKSDLDNRPVF